MRSVITVSAILIASLMASVLAPQAMALDRAALASGELWRLWTGHLVHWSLGHLLWDGLTFAVLGWLLNRLAPFALELLMAIGAPLISVGVIVAEPDLALYGGLSGLDVALWVAVCLAIVRRRVDPVTSALAWLLLAGCVVKVGFEIATGQVVFADGSFLLVPSAHVAGAVLGWSMIAAPSVWSTAAAAGGLRGLRSRPHQ